jgi:DNA-binding NtrC family response regulator
LKGKTMVLVIEDEDLLREAIEEILKEAGFQALSAELGQTGLALFQQYGAEIQVVLLDQRLPDMRGVDLLPHLRVLDSHVRVILCSGFLEAAISERLHQEDALWFLQKPYAPATLLAKLHEVLAPAAAPHGRT